MRVLIRQVLLSPLVWSVLLVVMAGVAGLVIAAMAYQRQDYQRTLDAVSVRAVAEIKDQITKLREADAKSAKDRNEIKKEVEGIKEDIDSVPPPFMRAGKAFKRGIDKALEKGANP